MIKRQSLDNAIDFMNSMFELLLKHLRHKHVFGLTIRILKRLDIHFIKRLVIGTKFEESSIQKFQTFYKSLTTGTICRIHKNPGNLYRK